MFNGIKEAFRSALNWIIDKWNGLSWSIPGVDTHIPGVGKIGGFTLSTPNIPRLAKGGIVTRPTLLWAGEGGQPEGVFPLSRAREFGFGAGVGDLGTVRFELSLDGRVIQTKLLRLKRENGGLELGIS
jgi:hypothetical protein